MTKAEIQQLLYRYKVPVVGLVGYSGSGKTTLLEAVISHLKAEGINIAVIKASHHDIEIDKPGKDSYRLRQAGADTTLVCCPQRIAAVQEWREQRHAPGLEDALALIPQQTELVLVEGFKHEPYLKIVVTRGEKAMAKAVALDQHTIAVATDLSPDLIPHQQILNINRPEETANFILNLIRVRS